MLVKMRYATYKSFYSELPAKNYDPTSKTIMVDIPYDFKRIKFPKEWKRYGNHYTTPNNTRIYFWNTGYSENFLIERGTTIYNRQARTIPPSLNARQTVIDTVSALESNYKTVRKEA